MPSKSVRDWSPLVQLGLSLQMEPVRLVLLAALNALVLLSVQSAKATDFTPLEDCASVDAVTESRQETKDAMTPTVSTETVAQPHAQSKPTGYVLATDQLPADPTAQLFAGDGRIGAGEQCDDGNRASGDGCTNCRVDNGWTCDASGCRRIVVPPNPTDNSNLELVGDVKFNFNNVFCVFRTPKSYPGLTELEKKNFLKYRFASKTEEPTSAYCVQSATAFDRWECLMIYASGLPNYKYKRQLQLQLQRRLRLPQPPHQPTQQHLQVPFIKMIYAQYLLFYLIRNKLSLETYI
jgi:cysteine-rich repeat protein